MTVARRGLMLRLLWRQPHPNCHWWPRNDWKLYTTWKSQKIREVFINFFKCRHHRFVPSSVLLHQCWNELGGETPALGMISAQAPVSGHCRPTK
ncbi:hypothetical protein LSAT2_025242 [Lamellibrachia satsuma]|nr:hypothetical protein LSAT2_025242 [Lamellibrachia satsuma]